MEKNTLSQMREWSKIVAEAVSQGTNEGPKETDLRLRFDQLGADLAITQRGDISTISEIDNLAQAIIARLSTEEGELYDIGHADYGSRLHEVIGEMNDELAWRKIKVLVQECLDQEPRIKKIIDIKVLPDPIERYRVNIEVTVLTRFRDEYLSLIYPYRLEG
jgi:phage baseplate assembly protein W